MSSSPRRLTVLLAALLCAPALLHAQQTSFPFQDRTLPIDRRIDDLVSRMTLEEKASQMVNRTRAIPRLNLPEYNIWFNVVVGQEPGVRIDEQSLNALPANPTFAPYSVNIYEFPVK